MTVNFQIDRVDPPAKFYTLKNGYTEHNFTPGTHVFSECALHSSEGWVTLGLISRETPFGQSSTHRGFPLSALRRATPSEVRVALTFDHPDGPDYIPGIQPYMSTMKYRIIHRRWKSITRRQLKAVLSSLPKS